MQPPNAMVPEHQSGARLMSQGYWANFSPSLTMSYLEYQSSLLSPKDQNIENAFCQMKFPCFECMYCVMLTSIGKQG